MNNQGIKKGKSANIVTKVSLVETLLAINIGESTNLPSRIAKSASVRMTAKRLEEKKKAKFYVTEKGLINETLVMRLG